MSVTHQMKMIEKALDALGDAVTVESIKLAFNASKHEISKSTIVFHFNLKEGD